MPLVCPILPKRIECFDISHIQGAETVASMVVWEDGQMKKSDYRKFIIRDVTGVDDFASMREVVTRRYKRLQEENKKMPSLVLIDGGLGQLHAAARGTGSPGNHQPAAGGDRQAEEIIYVYGQESEPIALDHHSPVLHLVQLIRDEVHRFAVTFHRKRRQIRDRARTAGDPRSGREHDPALAATFWQRPRRATGRRGRPGSSTDQAAGRSGAEAFSEVQQLAVRFRARFLGSYSQLRIKSSRFMPRRKKARRLQQGILCRELVVLVAIAVSVCFFACLKGYASQSQSGASVPATIPKDENSNGRAEAARLYAEAEQLYRLGAYEKAQQAAENALQLRGQSPGRESPEAAACLVLLGRIADGKDDFARGAGLYKQALAIDEKALGKNSLEEADVLDGQARNFTSTAKYPEAEEAGKRALHIREEKLAPNDILIAKSLETLADLYKEKGDYAGAASVASRA